MYARPPPSTHHPAPSTHQRTTINHPCSVFALQELLSQRRIRWRPKEVETSIHLIFGARPLLLSLSMVTDCTRRPCRSRRRIFKARHERLPRQQQEQKQQREPKSGAAEVVVEPAGSFTLFPYTTEDTTPPGSMFRARLLHGKKRVSPNGHLRKYLVES